MWRPAQLLLILLLASACTRSDGARSPSAGAFAIVRSNILRADYAGSVECSNCHANIDANWQRSPMRNMTRAESRAEIRAPFDGTSFMLQGDSITMTSASGKRFMQIVSTDRPTKRYRITKIIGGRYREDFVGIDVTDAADPVTDRGRGAEEVMPASFVFSTNSWRYKGYSVMTPERPHLRAGPVWAKTCIGCHNTMPYLTMLYDDLTSAVGGSDDKAYQGSVTDDLLPKDRTFSFVPTDEAGLARAINDEIVRIGGTASNGSLRDVLALAIDVTRKKLQGNHLVDLGVGCESCHGGSKEHAEDPRVRPSFELRSPFMAQQPPRSDVPNQAQWINHTCARCHTVLFSGYPWTWEGGRRSDAVPGGSTTNSGEGHDFLLGACASKLSCVACHDPHAEDRADAKIELQGASGTTLCTSCHPSLAGDAAIAAHTHHRPGGAGSSCIGCHMPKKNMSLGYALGRYHRIGSPTDDDRVLRDRPLECALCHADKSVESLTATMEQWWNKKYSRPALRQLYGDDLNANAISTTLARGKPHEQAVAILLLGDGKDVAALPLLVPQLAHEYPLIRLYAKHAIEILIGKSVPIDINDTAAQILDAGKRWLASYRSPT